MDEETFHQNKHKRRDNTAYKDFLITESMNAVAENTFFLRVSIQFF